MDKEKLLQGSWPGWSKVTLDVRKLTHYDATLWLIADNAGFRILFDVLRQSKEEASHIGLASIRL